MTKVVNIRIEPCEVFVGRPSIWGNPFVIGKDGSRDEVIAKYESWLKRSPGLMAKIQTLKDKVLGCYCAPCACHADVLAKLADDSTLQLPTVPVVSS